MEGCCALINKISQHVRKVHTKNNTKNNLLLINNVIKCYRTWKDSDDSGGGSEKTKQQHVDQAARILHSKSTGSFKNALSEMKVLEYIKGRTAEGNGKHLVASSAATYLFGLHNFYKFLDTSFSAEFFSKNKLLIPMDLAQVKLATNCLADSTLRWAKGFTKRSKINAHVRYEAERALLLTTDEKKRCLRGDLYTTVKQIMFLTSNGKMFSNEEKTENFLNVRNYLMLNIFVRNGHRTGVVSNLTLKEFATATLKEERFMIKVLDHKTNDEYGFANIIVSKSFFKILEFYKERLRPNFAKDNSQGNFFIAITGNNIKSGNVSKTIKSTAERLNIDERKLMPRLVRKTTTTTVIEGQQPGELNDVTALMLHLESTALKSHQRTVKEMSALRGEKMINRYLWGSDVLITSAMY